MRMGPVGEGGEFAGGRHFRGGGYDAMRRVVNCAVSG
jgi:hypothetical protein